jgi:hypothetical protein
MLYMFQAVSPPNIRSSKLDTQQASFTASCCVYSFEFLMMGVETA